MHRFALVATLMVFAAPLHAASAPCPAGRDPILILGTFHMEGGSEDAVKSHPGDMTTPKRQAEIEALVEKLARFRPTVVAIESQRISNYWNDRYAEWLDGRYTLGTNEIEQVGFRLAKRMGLARLTPVDYSMWMDGLTPAERHTPKPAPKSAASAATPDADPSPLMLEIRRAVARDDSMLAHSTVSAYYAYLNTPEQAALHHRWDVISNLEPGSGDAIYENTDLAANWYKRNLRIFTNILDARKPGDRVFLLIGAGHLQILGDLASASPGLCRVDPRDYLK